MAIDREIDFGAESFADRCGSATISSTRPGRSIASSSEATFIFTAVKPLAASRAASCPIASSE